MAFTLLFSDIAIVLKRELLFIPIVGWAMARAGNIAVARGDGAVGPARPGQAGQGGDRRWPLDRDLPRRDPGGAGRPAAVPGRHGGPLSPARRAGGAGGAQLRPVLGAPEVDQAARHDHARGAAADRTGIAPRGVHGNPAGPDRDGDGAPGRNPQSRWGRVPSCEQKKNSLVDIPVFAYLQRMDWAPISQRIWDMKYRFRDPSGVAMPTSKGHGGGSRVRSPRLNAIPRPGPAASTRRCRASSSCRPAG